MGKGKGKAELKMFQNRSKFQPLWTVLISTKGEAIKWTREYHPFEIWCHRGTHDHVT